VHAQRKHALGNRGDSGDRSDSSALRNPGDLGISSNRSDSGNLD
jgi:hypothetical protein